MKLISRIEKAVLPVFVNTGPGSLGMGSGAVIHPAGFVLTADHVTQSYPGVVLFGLQRVPYEIVGRVPERDVALLKVDPKYIEAVTRIGRSHDLKAGEPIIVGGNPSGRGIVFSQGSINAPSIDPSWPNVLVMSYWRTDLDQSRERQSLSTGGRPTFIQFDAISNKGNSGGPLINFEGNLIGIVSTKSTIEEGINWAVPIDRIRLLTPCLLDPEVVNGFFVGIEVNLLETQARITEVRPGSPAENAGLKVDDILTSVNGEPIESGPEWSMLLHGHKVGDELKVEYVRSGEKKVTTIPCVEYPAFDVASAEGKASGVNYRLYKGRFPKIPEFSTLEPVKQGELAKVTHEGVVEAEATEYGIVFTGYLKFPKAGLYRLHLGSDDGSKLFIGGKLIIDNDLPHPYQKLSRWIRVPEGLIPFQVEYAETAGDKALTLEATRDYDPEGKVKLEYYRDVGNE